MSLKRKILVEMKEKSHESIYKSDSNYEKGKRIIDEKSNATIETTNIQSKE